MKNALGFSVVLVIAPLAQAADIEAGKAKVATVCAACHGAAGVSVSDTIPNLAAKRARYLEAQLKALKDGTRKNPIMSAIAAQLSADDMANVAAYFAAQPGAGTGAKSAFLANVARTHVTFPEGYQDTFTKYYTINFPATKQVRYYYANKAAVQAAKDGKPLPDGSVLFAEVHAAKLDAGKNPVSGSTASTRRRSCSSTRRWRAARGGAGKSPTCCATASGTTPSSRSTSSTSPG